VNKRLVEAARKRGIPSNKVFGTCRVTQVYDTGAAVYTYFGLAYGDMPLARVMQVYEEIEVECRDEILKCGGSISHHHGVGKVRKRFVKSSMTPFGIELQ
jgi:alkyldihydroxyacetonephosphate synthase